jgi:hypothetical protein
MTAIEVEGLTKRYGAKVAVDDVSFAVAEGEIFGLLGRNGAGKAVTELRRSFPPGAVAGPEEAYAPASAVTQYSTDACPGVRERSCGTAGESGSEVAPSPP